MTMLGRDGLIHLILIERNFFLFFRPIEKDVILLSNTRMMTCIFVCVKVYY